MVVGSVMKPLLPLLLTATFSAADVHLRDHPITTTAAPTYLDGDSWIASTVLSQSFSGFQPNLTIPAVVPGDLLTDLYDRSRPWHFKSDHPKTLVLPRTC